MSQVMSKASLQTDSKKKLSMHEDVAEWRDCCVCEAEPYWMDVAEELGIDINDDQEHR